MRCDRSAISSNCATVRSSSQPTCREPATTVITRSFTKRARKTQESLPLDDFKQANDLYGHAVGDALLQAVADRLMHAIRIADTAARLGGDEFALLFVGVQETSEGPSLCAKVEQEVCRPLDVGSLKLTPAFSIGYAIYPRDGKTLDTLLKMADGRMYQAKRARKERDEATGSDQRG